MKGIARSAWREKYHRHDRIDSLTDGIFAVAMTLLVLELKVPELTKENSFDELWVETKKVLPHLSSFLLSFLWIANSWHSNQSYNRLLVKSDAAVVWLQLFILMITCLYPYPTAMMGEYPHNPAGVIYFGILVNIGGLLVVALTQYTIRMNYVSEEVDLDDLRKRVNMIPKLLPLYLIPVAVGFYYPVVGQCIFFALGVSWIFQTSKWKLKDPIVQEPDVE